MSTQQTQLFPPPLRDSELSEAEQKYLATLQYLHPLVEVDTSAGPVVIALPNPGLDNSATGQSNQNQELIYIKTTADVNTVTINGGAAGPVTLIGQYDIARYKSNATKWYRVG